MRFFYLYLLFVFSYLNALHVADFDESMKINDEYFDLPSFSLCLNHRDSIKAYNLLKQVYNRNIERDENGDEYKIPKIIHQIWIGSEVPERYEKLQESWKEHHPDWEYILWTDVEVAELDMINRDLFDNASHIVQKVDLLRYEILYKYGGLYVDMDFECFKPVDYFHKNYTFYSCLVSLEKFPFLNVNNAIIGCSKHNKIMKHNIRSAVTRGRNLKKVLKLNRQFPIYAGYLLTNSVLECFEKNPEIKDAIILPATYFYPVKNRHEETYGFHYWDATWLKI